MPSHSRGERFAILWILPPRQLWWGLRLTRAMYIGLARREGPFRTPQGHACHLPWLSSRKVQRPTNRCGDITGVMGATFITRQSTWKKQRSETTGSHIDCKESFNGRNNNRQRRKATSCSQVIRYWDDFIPLWLCLLFLRGVSTTANCIIASINGQESSFSLLEIVN